MILYLDARPGAVIYCPGVCKAGHVYAQKWLLLKGSVTRMIESEVDKLRTRITLACTECKQRNYNTKKEKKLHPDRMETKKYCRFCKKHTVHKETK